MVRRHKKLIIFILLITLISSSVVAFIFINSTPDSFTQEERDEAVADILGRKPNLNPNIKKGNTNYESELISFSYPARATIYEYIDEGKRNNDSQSETFSFDLENPRIVFNNTATEIPSTRSLDDVPAVKLRMDESRGYKSDELTLGGASGVSFSREGGGSAKAEKSAFFLSDGVLFTFSLTGSNLEDIEEVFDEIAKSVVFN